MGRPAKRAKTSKHVTFADPIATFQDPADSVTLQYHDEIDSLLGNIKSSPAGIDAHLLNACRDYFSYEDIAPRNKARVYVKLSANALRKQIAEKASLNNVLLNCGAELLADRRLELPLRAQVAHNVLVSLHGHQSDVDAGQIHEILRNSLEAATFIPFGANAYTLKVQFIANVIHSGSMARMKFDETASVMLTDQALTLLKDHEILSKPLAELLTKTMLGAYNSTLTCLPKQHESLTSIASNHLAQLHAENAPVETRAHVAANLLAHINRFSPAFSEQHKERLLTHCLHLVQDQELTPELKAPLVANLAVGSLLRSVNPVAKQQAELLRACFETLGATDTMPKQRYLISSALVTAAANRYIVLSQDHGLALVQQSMESLRSSAHDVVNSSHLAKCLLEAIGRRRLRPPKHCIEEIVDYGNAALHRREVPIQTKLVIIINFVRMHVERYHLLTSDMQTELVAHMLSSLPVGMQLTSSHVRSMKLLAQLVHLDCLPLTPSQTASMIQAAHQCCSSDAVPIGVKKEIATSLTIAIKHGTVVSSPLQQRMVRELAEAAAS